MESSQPIELPNTSWGRPCYSLILIDWLLKRMWDRIQIATDLARYENDLAKRSTMVERTSATIDLADKLLFLSFCVLIGLSFGIRDLIETVIPRPLAWIVVCLLMALSIFGAGLRSVQFNRARIKLWQAGGTASFPSLIATFPKSCKSEEQDTDFSRAALLADLLEEPKAVHSITEAHRQKLIKYCAGAERYLKSKPSLLDSVLRIKAALERFGETSSATELNG